MRSIYYYYEFEIVIRVQAVILKTSSTESMVTYVKAHNVGLKQEFVKHQGQKADSGAFVF